MDNKKSGVQKVADVCVSVIKAIGAGIKFIVDNIDPSDELIKVNRPYSRQSYAEKARNSHK